LSERYFPEPQNTTNQPKKQPANMETMTFTFTTETTIITTTITIENKPSSQQSQEHPESLHTEEDVRQHEEGSTHAAENATNERTQFSRLAMERISTLITQGRKIINLHEDLYIPLGAEGRGETLRKNGIRFGVCSAKTENIIRKTGVRGVYSVV
jgi:hypothetical protein